MQDLAQFAQFCASFNENPIDEVNSLTIDRNILIVFQIPKYSRPQKLMFIYRWDRYVHKFTRLCAQSSQEIQTTFYSHITSDSSQQFYK